MTNQTENQADDGFGELEFEILKAAVNLSKTRGAVRAKTLRERLRASYPGQDAAIDRALRCWADYAVASARRNGESLGRP